MLEVASQIDKEISACAIVGSATVPTKTGGHGGPPYGPKHLKFHMSPINAEFSTGYKNRRRNENDRLLR
jgi:hypothetical protein